MVKRAWEHNNDFIEGFTKTHAVHRLVHFELCTDMITAIAHEKQIKHCNRAWKLRIIEKMNPDREDLWPMIL